MKYTIQILVGFIRNKSVICLSTTFPSKLYILLCIISKNVWATWESGYLKNFEYNKLEGTVMFRVALSRTQIVIEK